MKTRKQDYEEYLNELGLSLDDENFIIDGKFRASFYPHRYGTALRRYDPIAFEVGYRDWIVENTKQIVQE